MNSTTPQSLSDLPELPEPANPGYHPGSGYYTADQLREYGRLCRATDEQAGKVEGDTIEEVRAKLTAREWAIVCNRFADHHAKPTQPAARCEECGHVNSDFEPGDLSRMFDAKPAATQDAENIDNIESYAGVLERMARCNPRTADDFNLTSAARHIRDYVALLRAAPVSPSREVEALATPTERGWYWHHDGEVWRMLFVFPRPGHSYLAVQDDSHPVTGKRHFRMADKIGGRWVGPLETPTLAPVQEKAP